MLLLIIILCFSVRITAQNINVLNKEGKPVSEAMIINEDNKKTVITNEKGEADISLFSEEEKLIISHISYKNLVTTKEELKKTNYKIELSETLEILNEVVVSSSRWAMRKQDIPNRVKSIRKVEIEYNTPQTTADLISAKGEVFVQKSQLGGGSPMIRGFAANKILLVVDGVRMNNAIYRSGNLQNILSVDAESVERSEIIFGPASVSYGSGALGGVISFSTLEPKFSESKPEVKAKLQSRYSSANKEKTIHADFNVYTKKLSWISSFTHNNFGDLKAGTKVKEVYNNVAYREIYADRIGGKDIVIENKDKSLQKQSAYKQTSVLQKIAYKVSDKLKLTYSLNYSITNNIPRYDRLAQRKGDGLKYAEWYYGAQKWLMNSVKIESNYRTLIFDKVRTIFAIQNYEESRHDRKFNKAEKRERYEEVTAKSFCVDFDKSIKKAGNIYYGAEYIINDVKSYGEKTDIENNKKEAISSRYPDNSEFKTYAVYLNYKINIYDKISWLAGGRYSRIKQYAPFHDKRFFDFPFDEINIDTDNITGSTGITYRPIEALQLNMNIASGFRAPNLDDLAKVFDSADDVVVVPNNNLNPEKTKTLDIAVHYQNSFMRIGLTVFKTWLKDAMVRRDFLFNGKDELEYNGNMCKVQALINADKAEIKGINSYLEFYFRNFEIVNNFTLTRGKDNEGIPLRHVSPPFGYSSLKYKYKRMIFDLNINYNLEKKADEMATSEKKKHYMYALNEKGEVFTPSWTCLNFKFKMNINKYLGINTGVDNIFDTYYRPYSSGIGAAGRNFYISIIARY